MPRSRKPCEKICYPKRIQAELVFREMGDDTLQLYLCYRHTVDGKKKPYWHLGHERRAHGS